MSNTCIHVGKKSNETVPEQYGELALKHNDTYFGCALAAGGKITRIVRDEMITLEELMQTQEKVKSSDIVYAFGNAPDGVHKDDLQPYILITDDEDSPVLVGFLDGDFSNYAQVKSSHTDAFFAAQELAERLQDVYDTVDGNMEKFWIKLNSPMMKKDVFKMFGERGTITLLANTGQMLSFSENETYKDYTWGFTTNRYEYTEGEFPKKVESLADQLMSGVGTKAEKKSKSRIPTDTPTEEKEDEKPPVELPTDKTATKVPETVAPLDKVFYTPPKGLDSKKNKNAVKQGYRDALGYVPSNWREKPTVEVTGKKLKSFQAMAGVSSTPPTEPEKSDTKVKHIASTVPIVPSVPIPIIPKDDKESIMEHYLTRPSVAAAIAKAEAEGIVDPKDLKGKESKYPTFAQAVGLKGLSDTFRWEYTDLLFLAKNYHEAFVILFMNTQAALIEQLIKIKPDKEEQEEQQTPQRAVASVANKKRSRIPL